MGAGLAFALAGAAASSCTCFVRGTQVATPKGPRAIEDLQIGDEVWSYSLADCARVVRTVAALVRSRASEILAVQAGEFCIAGVTAEHPFWNVVAGTWQPAGSLTLGSVLLAALDARELRAQPVTALSRVAARGEVEVFNLTIAGDEQNYFAGGVLVHNKSPECHGCYQRPDAEQDVATGDTVSDVATDASSPTDASID